MFRTCNKPRTHYQKWVREKKKKSDNCPLAANRFLRVRQVYDPDMRAYATANSPQRSGCSGGSNRRRWAQLSEVKQVIIFNELNKMSAPGLRGQ